MFEFEPGTEVEVHTFTYDRRSSGGYTLKIEKSWQRGRILGRIKHHVNVVLDNGLKVNVLPEKVRPLA